MYVSRSISASALALVTTVASLGGCSVDEDSVHGMSTDPVDGQDLNDGSGGVEPVPGQKTIFYGGGPIMSGSNTKVYVIWYGDWSARASSQAIITDFLSNLGGSPYWAINHTYNVPSSACSMPSGCTGSGRVSTGLVYAGSTTDAYSQGSSLTNAYNNASSVKPIAIVNAAVTSHRLPSDTTAIYAVVVSPDVFFGASYCAYHTLTDGYANAGTGGLKLTVSGRAGDLSGCSFFNYGQPTPNADHVADDNINELAHELSEAVTNPNPMFQGWSGASYPSENADQCSWNAGPKATWTTLPSGSSANLHLGARDYMIQQNLVNGSTSSYCAMSAPATP
jgi:hypothetical protein